MKEYFRKLQINATRVPGAMTCAMAMGLNIGPMETAILVSIKMMRNMEEENSNGLMEKFMKDSLYIIVWREKE